MKSKIVKKKDLDILIESTLKNVGIETKKVVVESKKPLVKKSVEKTLVKESEDKSILNENVQKELEQFRKLTNYTYKK